MADVRRAATTATAYTVADGLIRGITFVLLPLLASHLDRAAFGTLGALSAISAFLTQILGFGLAGASIRFYHTMGEVERREFIGSSFLWTTAAAGVCTSLLHFAAPGVSTALGVSPDLVPLIRVTLWTAILHVIARTVPLGLFRAREDWRSYLAVSIATFTGTLGAVYWRLALLEQGLVGAVRGLRDGALLTALVATFLATRHMRFSWKPEHVRTGLRYGAPLIPHNIAHWTLGLSDRLIIARVLGPDLLGVYHFAYQFAAGLQMLVTAMNSALMPLFARIREGSSARDVAGLGRISALFFAATLTIALGLSATVPPLIEWLSPTEYASAAPLVPWLLVGLVFFGYYCIPANILTMSLGETRHLAWFTGTAAILNALINVALLSVFGLNAAVCATVGAYLVMAVGVDRFARARTPLMVQVANFLGTRQVLAVTGISILGIVTIQHFTSSLASLTLALLLLSCSIPALAAIVRRRSDDSAHAHRLT